MPLLHNDQSVDAPVPVTLPDVTGTIGILDLLWWLMILVGVAAIVCGFAMRDRGYGPPDVRLMDIPLKAVPVGCVGVALVASGILLLIYGT